jgi:protein TonB
MYLALILLALLVGLPMNATAQSAVSAPAGAAPTAPVCSNYSEVMGDVTYPAEAIAQNIHQGSALVEFTLSASGKISNVRAIEYSHPIFASASEAIVAKYQCRELGKSIQVQVPFKYRLE